MVLSAGLLIATIVDLRTRRIPNELTGTMAVPEPRGPSTVAYTLYAPYDMSHN